MKNLGKIFILLILFTHTIYANVTATVEPSVVYSGETATYRLTISGESVTKPALSDICGNDITATSSQTSIQYINGDYKKSYILSYEFMPQKSCTIAPVTVEIDGKEEQSNSVKLLVKPKSQNMHANFILNLTPSKKELYVGEPFLLHLELKQREGAEALDSKFVPPDFKGFWMKGESEAKRTRENGFIVTRMVYKLAAQREGNLTIEPATLKIATRIGSNNWGTLIPRVKWSAYYSNSVALKVKALPNNAKIIGDFTLSAKAEKLEVNANEPVNVTVTLKGEGNLEDVDGFKPYIQDVNVFDEKVAIDGDTLTQKLVFVGDRDFTIPPFELVYFNTKTGKVQKLKTEPIHVKVNGAVAKSDVKVEIKRNDSATTTPQKQSEAVKTTVEVRENYILIGIAFVFGLLVGASLMLFRRGERLKKGKKLNLKDEKLLLIKLMPFKDDAQVQEIVDILEHNIYSKEKKAVDKKILKEVIQRYDIT